MAGLVINEGIARGLKHALRHPRPAATCRPAGSPLTHPLPPFNSTRRAIFLLWVASGASGKSGECSAPRQWQLLAPRPRGPRSLRAVSGSSRRGSHNESVGLLGNHQKGRTASRAAAHPASTAAVADPAVWLVLCRGLATPCISQSFL